MFAMKDGDYRLFDLPPVVKNETPVVPANEVKAVFDHWVTTHRTPRRGPEPVLSEKRKTRISKAITDYGVEVCLQAVSGCAMSEWHMGDNPRRKRYDDIELILRDAAHIERFATIYMEGDEDVARDEFLSGGESE
jgi:hypothetical protein